MCEIVIVRSFYRIKPCRTDILRHSVSHTTRVLNSIVFPVRICKVRVVCENHIRSSGVVIVEGKMIEMDPS